MAEGMMSRAYFKGAFSLKTGLSSIAPSSMGKMDKVVQAQETEIFKQSVVEGLVGSVPQRDYV